MYIGYLDDRQKSNFKCSKDLNSFKQICYINNKIKSKKIFITLLSKKILVGVSIFIQFNRTDIKPDLILQENSKSPSSIICLTLKLNGGNLDEEKVNKILKKINKLVNSIISKSNKNSWKAISVNKSIKKS